MKNIEKIDDKQLKKMSEQFTFSVSFEKCENSLKTNGPFHIPEVFIEVKGLKKTFNLSDSNEAKELSDLIHEKYKHNGYKIMYHIGRFSRHIYDGLKFDTFSKTERALINPSRDKLLEGFKETKKYYNELEKILDTYDIEDIEDLTIEKLKELVELNFKGQKKLYEGLKELLAMELIKDLDDFSMAKTLFIFEENWILNKL
ncbi:hypothetical protein SCHIN_v1c07570 [Spiroplasma chinense]|uniref:Uncharacterized protein n=1 Tax=Spiroplasma chinense TaxID=216932 RepID=A0A5B9Y775_9MOLU|nr:hypothetical protein [Spiroplasma chinense]QEH61952.1 hypothetical protein SCHIN_v1c07570 [Spiroplasma chinense]